MLIFHLHILVFQTYGKQPYSFPVLSRFCNGLLRLNFCSRSFKSVSHNLYSHYKLQLVQIFHMSGCLLFIDPLLNLLNFNDHVSAVIKCVYEHLSSLSKRISVHLVQTWGNQNYMIRSKHGLRADASNFTREQWGLWNWARFLTFVVLSSLSASKLYTSIPSVIVNKKQQKRTIKFHIS